MAIEDNNNNNQTQEGGDTQEDRKSEKPQWFQQNVTSINPEAQSLMESYSGFKSEEVLPHVLALRDEAFKVYHYSCIGQLRFLSFNLSHMPFWWRVFERLRADPKAGFLDAGCCFGQEIRFLANKGIPHTQLYGCDLEKVFIDLGYRLFRDEGRLGATFVVGDLTAEDEVYEESNLAKVLRGKMDVIFASSLFHMWDYEVQVRVACRMVDMCRDREGVMITGRQLGSLLGGRYPISGMKEGGIHYRHNVETIKGFWHDVGEATNTRWTVEAGTYWGEEIEQTKNSPWAEPNMRMLWWCATRK
ncbi:hypothetical protein VTN77DRAFT_2095 [Rasamsonia byssochlamydoides]|uniref:uncharacterized protein n=1 Tax=Rasamsonia byssochlamydoides TaxID=89139 RepID=UPI003742AD34